MKGGCCLLLTIIILLAHVSASCNETQIDINSATSEELQGITQIGPSRAQQIISLRPFSSVEDLARVSGIGDGKRLDEIKSEGLACVGEEKKIVVNEEETNSEDEIISKVVYAKIESTLDESLKEITPIILSSNLTNSKDIKSVENKENLLNLPKSTYAFYGIIAFCVVFGLVFLLKKRKKQNELQ